VCLDCLERVLPTVSCVLQDGMILKFIVITIHLLNIRLKF